MSASLHRPLVLLALLVLLAAGALAAASSASAAAPDRWHNEACHDLDSGRILCIEDKGSIRDTVSESGHWTYQYRGDTTWTVYAAGGNIEYTERTRVHVLQSGQGGETHREHETFRYSYQSDDYSCRVNYQLHVVDGEIQLDHQVDDCTIS
ncbi:MAG: hypothetical protein WD557_10430 [Dehalococcoidia bacterium]